MARELDQLDFADKKKRAQDHSGGTVGYKSQPGCARSKHTEDEPILGSGVVPQDVVPSKSKTRQQFLFIVAFRILPTFNRHRNQVPASRPNQARTLERVRVCP